MKLPSGKRLGQSGYELALAVFYSFFLHASVVFAALVFSTMLVSQSAFRPVYQVKLVDLPREELAPAPLPPAEPVATALPPQEEPKKATPQRKAESPAMKPATQKVKAAATARNTNEAPEISAQKPKADPEQEPITDKAETKPKPSTAVPPGADVQAAGGGAVTVSLPTPQQDFNDTTGYLVRIRIKIGQNWRPPPDTKDAKARVVFTVSRSGRVGEVILDEEYSSGAFGFKLAAKRAILECRQFPPLPEDFSKQSLQFTVDLTAE